MTRTIACVACLDPGRSVHTLTFIAAVDIVGDLLANTGVKIVLYDDGADPVAGRAIADVIVASGTDCVVGHFASAAAAAAAPVYEAAGIPMLLPAATMSALTRYRCTYRICDNDDDYARWLARTMAERGLVPVRYASDGSAHGDSVIGALRAVDAMPGCSGKPAIVFAGRYAETIEFAKALAGACAGAMALVLTDDADAPSLEDDLALAGLSIEITPVYLAALRPRPRGSRAEQILRAYRQRHGADPGTYFWETVAAIEMAVAMPLDTGQSIETALGPLKPDVDGECRPHSFCLLRVGGEVDDE